MKDIFNILTLILGIYLFYSCKKDEVPSISTSEITVLTGTSATSGGNITDEGSGTVLSRGVCWSKSITPELSDNKTADGAGAGNFVSSLSGLNGATTYYIRAYATNDAGTGYGMTMSFKTLGDIPIAVTHFPTNVSSSEVTLNGAVNPNYFSADVTFEYGTSISYGSSIEAIPGTITGTTLSEVSATVLGLNQGTTYHFRIKAVNSLGITYGEDIAFIPPSTINDVDANIYQTVTIGPQTWMKENLKVTKYNDLTSIPYINNNTVWTDLITPGYGWYDNNNTYKDTYGALYNWFVVDASSNGNKNVCPTGWHVPSDSEWTTLIDFLGGLSIAGGKLKETGTLHWTSPNAGATNETGFTALPSGNRAIHGWFGDIHEMGYFWSVTEYDDLNAWFFSLAYSTSSSAVINSWKRLGLPIRCLKD